MPRSKTGKKRVAVNANNLTEAAKLVLTGELSIRKAAIKHEIAKSTLIRHIKAHKNSSSQVFIYSASNKTKQVFSNEEEISLKNYVLQAAHYHYGLTKSNLRKLAFQYADANKINYPESWKTDKAAGKEWLRQFLGRHIDLSLRKPEATSLARSTAFNRDAAGSSTAISINPEPSHSGTEEPHFETCDFIKTEQTDYDETSNSYEETTDPSDTFLEDYKPAVTVEDYKPAVTLEQPVTRSVPEFVDCAQEIDTSLQSSSPKKTCRRKEDNAPSPSPVTSHSHQIIMAKLDEIANSISNLANSQPENSFDQFGKYISSLLSKLPFQVACSLQQKMTEMVLGATVQLQNSNHS